VEVPEAPRGSGIHAPAVGKRIVIIQGHPDPDQKRFCHALGWNYEEGAIEGGHEVRTIDVARLDFPLLRTQRDFESGKAPAVIREAQEDIRWANHIVIIYPLWLGTLPALLKGFFEQTFRHGFALQPTKTGGGMKRLLKGRSARIIVTMGMPSTVYRVYFRAHGLKSLESSVLGMVGIRPIHATLFGLIANRSDKYRARCLEEVRQLGIKAK